MAEPRLSNKRRDLADPLNREAEDRVLAALIRTGHTVEDCRALNISWDFRFMETGEWRTLDVKRDTYIERTQNIPFEETLKLPDGREFPCWGWDERLDYLAVVGIGLRKAVVLRMADLRAHVTARRAFFDGGTPRAWVWMHRTDEETGKQTFGWAIPGKELPPGTIAGTLTLVPTSQGVLL